MKRHAARCVSRRACFRASGAARAGTDLGRVVLKFKTPSNADASGRHDVGARID
jgi:hypothetical protein